MELNFLSKLQALFRRRGSVEGVLAALGRFEPDQKSLSDLEGKASAFFGPNWKFNLEVYVNSLAPADRGKYAPYLKRALEFDAALSLWMSAQRIVKSAVPVSGDTMREFPKFSEYLPKFGIEGTRLLERLKKKIGVEEESKLLHKLGPAELAASSRSVPEPVREPPPGKPAAAPETAGNPEPVRTAIEPAPAVEPEPADAPVEVLPDMASQDWDIRNFIRVHSFLSSAREVMSAVVLDGGYKSLEDYPHYGFILDAVGDLIARGEKMLGSKSAAELKRYFKGGKAELEDLVEFYRRQRESEIAPEAKPDSKGLEKELGYVRVNGSGDV